jgi:hypothetical protein
MGTVTELPLNRVSNEELAIQLWELTMAGERDSDAFRRIDAEMRGRNSHQRELRLATVTPHASNPKTPLHVIFQRQPPLR